MREVRWLEKLKWIDEVKLNSTPIERKIHLRENFQKNPEVVDEEWTIKIQGSQDMRQVEKEKSFQFVYLQGEIFVLENEI